MEGGCAPAAGSAYRWLGAGEERLDRALVAGLMLDAALGALPLPPDPQARGRVLKTRVQEALLSHLAGCITLDRFRSLIYSLEQSFSFYFPLVSSLLPQGKDRPGPPRTPLQPAGGSFPVSRAVHRRLLAEELGRLQGILPQRPGSKLTGPKLHDFLNRTGGAWFRLRDFQEHFAMDRKTAWEYVHKLLPAGLLVHNQKRAAAVRYGLADKFLKVRAGDLRREVAALLQDLPYPLGSQVADRLITGAGEPFWEEEWGRFLPGAHFQEIISFLTSPDDLLEVVSCPDAQNRLLRLQERWLQDPQPAS